MQREPEEGRDPGEGPDCAARLFLLTWAKHLRFCKISLNPSLGN